MACGPVSGGVKPAEMFDFDKGGAYQRSMQNATVLWTAPWRAWWALAAEATATTDKR